MSYLRLCEICGRIVEVFTAGRPPRSCAACRGVARKKHLKYSYGRWKLLNPDEYRGHYERYNAVQRARKIKDYALKIKI